MPKTKATTKKPVVKTPDLEPKKNPKGGDAGSGQPAGKRF